MGHHKQWAIMRSGTKTSFISVVWKGKQEFEFILTRTVQVAVPKKGLRTRSVGTPGGKCSHY